MNLGMHQQTLVCIDILLKIAVNLQIGRERTDEFPSLHLHFDELHGCSKTLSVQKHAGQHFPAQWMNDSSIPSCGSLHEQECTFFFGWASYTLWKVQPCYEDMKSAMQGHASKVEPLQCPYHQPELLPWEGHCREVQERSL
jgi:hypothetical protein